MLRMLVVIAATVGFVAWLGVASVGRAEPSGDIHYPDLRTRVPSDLRITIESGKKLLRFSNTVYNFGDGPWELRPKHLANTKTEMFQRLYSHDANGKPYLISETFVGISDFHRPHRHWHVNDIALYQLFRDGAGSIGDLITGTSKTSVCIRDNASPEAGASSLEHFGWGGYSRCDKKAIQGLRVGYGDTYPWNIDGQSLAITGLADGCYWLRSTANPNGNFLESDTSNNSAAVRFSISGNDITGCP